MRIGIHTSIAGGLERAARERLGLGPLAVHDIYLINLAAADEGVRAKSVAAFRREIERALAIGAEYLIFHPGSCRGQTLEQGIGTLARSLGEAAHGVRRRGLMLLVENTAGQGSALGRRFEELAEIRRLAARWAPFEIIFCLDTAHCLAAGYDVATKVGLESTLAEAEGTLGLESVKVIHANDSKAPLGARVDRHEHIGAGYIGISGFRRILQHSALRDKAFILETPIEHDGDDRRNLDTLKSLCRRSRTITSRSS